MPYSKGTTILLHSFMSTLWHTQLGLLKNHHICIFSFKVNNRQWDNSSYKWTCFHQMPPGWPRVANHNSCRVVVKMCGEPRRLICTKSNDRSDSPWIRYEESRTRHITRRKHDHSWQWLPSIVTEYPVLIGFFCRKLFATQEPFARIFPFHVSFI